MASESPKLLSGGNPQIPKGDGPGPVQAYLDALPGWKQDVGVRLDALIMKTVPHAKKAVRWNTPFYGVEGEGWFVGFHALTKYIKVSFFRGDTLDPVPPVSSKVPHVRYLHLTETGFDEEQLERWIRQASEQPGENVF